ncbi:hypothetical protein LCGC14_2507890 [marine sediment metagenome]|uniref:Uncharacterized protein n=1 Tax=marine sediment metagenome TaxID=412755 RepID=A0A0F9B0T1_9ZZZZ
MGEIIDIIGNKYGNLIVVSFHSLKNNQTFWNVLCDCGKEKIIRGVHLRGKRVKSCGCAYTKHGHSINSITYNAWRHMKARCLNPKHKSYKNYGARGIKVYERWLKFENFLEDMGEKPKGLTLERIDNNGNYESSNCKWATWTEQANNTRKNKIITFKGKHLTVAQWARILKINVQMLYFRLKRNWPPERALQTKD